MVPASNAFQPGQMVWMAPVQTALAPGQFLFDASVPSYDVSGAAAWSWPALQAQPAQHFQPDNSWLGSNQVPQQLPMNGGLAQPGPQVFIQSPADMGAWRAAPPELLGPQDFQECAELDSNMPSYEEAPSQVHMEDEALPAAHKAMEVEEQDELDAAQAHGEVRSSLTVSKSTLRRRRRQQAQMHSAEMQQWTASKEEDRSAADADVADQEETEADADAAQAHEHADKVLQQLRAGDHARQAAIAGMERMAFRTKTSCRAAQLALEKASANDAAALAWGMRGHVRSAVQSRFANYVIQKILETLPVSRASFIVQELLGSGGIVVRHRFGCRIVCRILEHGSLSEGATAQLLEEILDSGVEELCNHEFGSYVVRHLLEFGLPEHRQKIASALSTDVMGYSKQRFGSHVVEAALKSCSAEDQHMMVQQLLLKPDELLSLASNQFGHHVMRALLRVPPGELRREVVDAISPLATKMQSLRYGKRILQALNAASN